MKKCWRLGILLFALFSVGSTCWSQGSLTWLQTGGGNPLISGQESILFNGVTSPELVFEFGFVTDEIPAPGTILDAVTVTLQGSEGGVAVLLTADATGVNWAPTTSGGVAVPDDSLLRMIIAPPSDAPILGRGIAYTVTVPVPQGIQESGATLYFDLFDNQDAKQSLAWYIPPRVVPEPGVASLFAVGLLGFLIIRIRRKKIHAVARR